MNKYFVKARDELRKTLPLLDYKGELDKEEKTALKELLQMCQDIADETHGL